MSAVQLAADLGIEAAADLKRQLAAHLLLSQAVALDAGAVERVHTASVQVLCTFVRERRGSGYATTFSAASATFSDAVRLLGLNDTLGLPPAAGPNATDMEKAA